MQLLIWDGLMNLSQKLMIFFPLPTSSLLPHLLQDLKTAAQCFPSHLVSTSQFHLENVSLHLRCLTVLLLYLVAACSVDWHPFSRSPTLANAILLWSKCWRKEEFPLLDARGLGLGWLWTHFLFVFQGKITLLLFKKAFLSLVADSTVREASSHSVNYV